MKLKGDIVDRMRQVLGGKTPTEKRIKAALAELEALRAKQAKETEIRGVVVEVVEPSPFVISDGGTGTHVPNLAAPEKVAVVGPIEVPVQNFIPLGPDEDEDDDEPEVPPAAVIDPDEDPKVRAIREAAERREAMLMESIKNMEARITELAKARLPEEKEAAIGSGKLPVGVKAAGPVGYSGQAAMPRGKWFISPFGPKIEMMLCGCDVCVPLANGVPQYDQKMQHYYCVMCKRGPFDYQQKNPGGRKTWLAPGATWGISHETCTATCFQRYMEEVQVVLSQRGMEGASGKIPPKPALVPGSD